MVEAKEWMYTQTQRWQIVERVKDAEHNEQIRRLKWEVVSN